MSAPARPGTTAQLDLFVDGAETALLHALGEALAAGLFGTDEIRGPGTDPAEVAARAVLALLPLETRGLSEEVVRGRGALQAAAPGFFRHYLQRVGR